MHFLRADLDPLIHNISEYALGNYGLVMTAGFVSLTLGSLALLLGLLDGLPAAAKSRWGLICLALWIVGGSLVFIFKDGTIHGWGAALAFASIPPAALFMAASFRHDPDWRSFSPTSLLLGVLGLVALGLETVIRTGLVERILVAVEVGWLIALAARLYGSRRLTGKGGLATV